MTASVKEQEWQELHELENQQRACTPAFAGAVAHAPGGGLEEEDADAVNAEKNGESHCGEERRTAWASLALVLAGVAVALCRSPGSAAAGHFGLSVNFDDGEVDTETETETAASRWLQQAESASCNATVCATVDECGCVEEEEDKPVGQVVYEWVLIVCLVALSALFSGLTLGLMSLDLNGLEIVIGGDAGDASSEDAKNARTILPVRKHGNLLLCTLLLGNVSVNAALSILLADYTGGVVGFISSTAVIVVFGEIFPQAACSRHALWVGAKTIYVVRFFLVVLYPIAKPLSWVLDHVFHEEIGSLYSSSQLGKLLEIHVKNETIDADQAKMMGGALQYRTKTVSDVMTSKKDVFMLPAHQVLDFATLSTIFQRGYSRIPVFADEDRDKVVGLLLTKDLILIDPEDCTTVRAVIQFFGRPVHYLWPDTKLSAALALFRSGRAHLAVVQTVNNDDAEKDPFYEVAGLITLEDIIEEILQEEILDETDSNFEVARSRNAALATASANGSPLSPLDPTSAGAGAGAGFGAANNVNMNSINGGSSNALVDRKTFDFARLRLLDTNRQNALSEDEVLAIVAHLATNVDAFEAELEQGSIDKAQITALVASLPVLELKAGERLYVKGKPVTHCTLVLSGKMQVRSGSEGFRSDVGPWSLLGQGALHLDQPDGYAADFSATVTSSDGVRCVRVNRHNIVAMVAEMNERKQGESHEAEGLEDVLLEHDDKKESAGEAADGQSDDVAVPQNEQKEQGDSSGDTSQPPSS